VLSVIFEFDKDKVKYPSIPCNIDEDTTVYPLKGECVITGLDYLVAKNQGCNITIKEIFYIPFEKDPEIKSEDVIAKMNEEELEAYNKSIENNHSRPFRDCIKELQYKRSQYPKGTIGNLLYKELGNSLYGLTARGLNDKRKFDIQSKEMKRMIGNDLSNPIISS
jgi:hypothetical protein